MKAEFVVFDFDGTLYDGDSFIDFAIFANGKSKFMYSFLKSLPAILMWKLGLKTNEYAKQKLFTSLFKGIQYQHFLKICEDFFERLSNKIKPNVLEILNRHVKEGRKIYIITASPKEWILPWANKFNISDVISTGLEIKDDVITGNFSTPNCYGHEKARRFLQIQPDREKYILWAYGDSKGDKQILQLSDYSFRF